MPRDDRASWLRGVLKAARVRQDLSLAKAAVLIRRELGSTTFSKQSLQDWEEGVSQPRVDAFTGWARALGLELELDLVPAGGGTVTVRVPPQVAPACRDLATLDPADLDAVTVIIHRLKRHTR